jgi:hypothetical protein
VGPTTVTAELVSRDTNSLIGSGNREKIADRTNFARDALKARLRIFWEDPRVLSFGELFHVLHYA